MVVYFQNRALVIRWSSLRSSALFKLYKTTLVDADCEQTVKGKRILIAILTKRYRYGQLSSEVFFKIFDTKISPVLMYGADIWGIEYQHAVEKVHYYACKLYMCVMLNSSNDAILGECGRFPL